MRLHDTRGRAVTGGTTVLGLVLVGALGLVSLGKNAKNVSRTADPDYRPLVEAQKAKTERLAAEEAAKNASALARAKEAVGRWLQNLGFSGGRANVNNGWRPGGGA